MCISITHFVDICASTIFHCAQFEHHTSTKRTTKTHNNISLTIVKYNLSLQNCCNYMYCEYVFLWCQHKASYVKNPSTKVPKCKSKLSLEFWCTYLPVYKELYWVTQNGVCFIGDIIGKLFHYPSKPKLFHFLPQRSWKGDQNRLILS